MPESALVVSPQSPQVIQASQIYMPAFRLEEAKARREAFNAFVTSQLRVDIDYGGVGVGKLPALRKPGAEKLSTFFGLVPHEEIVAQIEDWLGNEHGGQPLFAYTTRVVLMRNDQFIASCTAHCNTWESRYRWRWVPQDQVPKSVKLDELMRRDSTIEEFQFAVEKKETGGPYGKPAEYWAMIEDHIKNKRAVAITKTTSSGKTYPAWRVPGTLFRIPNPDPYDGINSAMKISYKRAYVGAVLIATNASEFFSADLDDTGDDDSSQPRGGGAAADAAADPAEEMREAERAAATPASPNPAARAASQPPPPAPAATPAQEDVPEGLQVIYKIFSNGSREDRLAQFRHLEGFLFESMGEQGGELYREVLARHGVEHPSNFKSMVTARRAITDLYKICEAQQKRQAQ